MKRICGILFAAALPVVLAACGTLAPTVPARSAAPPAQTQAAEQPAHRETARAISLGLVPQALQALSLIHI